MAFPHPMKEEKLALEAPLPETLARFLTHLTATEEKDYGETF